MTRSPSIISSRWVNVGRGNSGSAASSAGVITCRFVALATRLYAAAVPIYPSWSRLQILETADTLGRDRKPTAASD